jgi:hypothetical protein
MEDMLPISSYEGRIGLIPKLDDNIATTTMKSIEPFPC